MLTDTSNTERRYFTSSPTFMLLASLFVFFGLDTTQYLVYADQLFKYVYFLAVIALLFMLVARHGVLNVRPAHAFLFLTLCIASAISFFIKIVLNYPQSYASALLPLVVVALMLAIPNHRSHVDYKVMSAFLLVTGIIFSTVHVGWQFLTEPGFLGLPFATASHEKTFILIFTLCLSLFMKRWGVLVYMVFLVAISMWLRPTSTMALGFLASVSIAMLFRLGANKLGSALTTLCVTLLSIYPLLFVLSPDTAATMIEIERPIKEFFAARSNYDFRIALMSTARSEFIEGSALFGKKLLGTPTVDAGPWGATIHSDFMIMLTQGGLVGYFLFVGALLGVVRCAITGLKIGITIQDESVSTFFKTACIGMVLFSVYISFNPIMQKYSVIFFFWFIFLISGIGWRNLSLDVVRRDKPAVA